MQQSPLPSARSWQDLCSFPRGCILGDPGPLAALWIHPTPAPGLGGLQSDDRQAGKAQDTRTKRRSVSRLAKGPGSCLDPAHVPAGSSDGTNLNAHAPRGGEGHARSARAGACVPPALSHSSLWPPFQTTGFNLCASAALRGNSFILPCEVLQRLSLRKRSPCSHAREAPGQAGAGGTWLLCTLAGILCLGICPVSCESPPPGSVRQNWGAGGGWVPVSESFCSPLAPTVKGSFRLVVRSLTSFPPSVRSSFGVLVRETLSLSWKRE